MGVAEDDLPPGWLTRFRRGLVAGATVVLLALLVLAVPALLAWLMPGADSISATTACRVAALTLLAGLRAGVTIQATVITVPPLLVTALVAAILAGPARRIEGRSGFLGLIGGFTAAAVLLARWSRLGSTHVSMHRTLAAALLFAVVVGGLARLVPAARRRLASRWRAVVRAAVAVSIWQFVAGTALVAGSLIVHFSDTVAVQRTVAPGASGLAVTLIAIAAIPNAAVLGTSYLLGPGFQLGAATPVSILHTRHGSVPLFPLLGALPAAGGVALVGIVLGVVTALGSGALVLGTAGRPRRWWPAVADVVAIAVAVGVLQAAVATVARGDVGNAALRGVGALGWLVGCFAAASVLAGALVCWTARAAYRAVRSGRSEQAATETVDEQAPVVEAQLDDLEYEPASREIYDSIPTDDTDDGTSDSPADDSTAAEDVDGSEESLRNAG